MFVIVPVVYPTWRGRNSSGGKWLTELVALSALINGGFDFIPPPCTQHGRH